MPLKENIKTFYSVKLHRCYMCGGSKIQIAYDPDEKKPYSACCDKCDAYCGEYKTFEDLVKGWNRRCGIDE